MDDSIIKLDSAHGAFPYAKSTRKFSTEQALQTNVEHCLGNARSH